MAEKILTKPTSFLFDQYLNGSGTRLRSFLLDDSDVGLRWRSDSQDRIHGGKRRTYLPHPLTVSDRLIFGGSRSFQEVMTLCTSAANAIMQGELGLIGWVANRTVTNVMPPDQSLVEHIDPVHFSEGVVVIGLGEATFRYQQDDGQYAAIDDPAESIMVVPAGITHSVENGGTERLSIVIANDTMLHDGMSGVEQKLHLAFNQS